jgi:hypothetical protein
MFSPASLGRGAPPVSFNAPVRPKVSRSLPALRVSASAKQRVQSESVSGTRDVSGGVVWSLKSARGTTCRPETTPERNASTSMQVVIWVRGAVITIVKLPLGSGAAVSVAHARRSHSGCGGPVGLSIRNAVTRIWTSERAPDDSMTVPETTWRVT